MRSVRPYSPAASCPDIKVGDTLLSINGVNVTSLSSGNGGALPAVMVQLKKTPRVELLLLRKMGHKSNSRALGSSTVISDDEDDDGQPVLSGEVVGAVVVGFMLVNNSQASPASLHRCLTYWRSHSHPRSAARGPRRRTREGSQVQCVHACTNQCPAPPYTPLSFLYFPLFHFDPLPVPPPSIELRFSFTMIAPS